MFSRPCVPHAILAKSHMPDLAKVMPQWNVESLETRPEDLVERRVTRRKVEFESLEFNKRFLATVPSEYDPIALREMFSPGFLTWVTTIDREIDFGVSEQQLYFLWRMQERSERRARAGARQRRQAVRARPPRDGRARRRDLSGGAVARRDSSRFPASPGGPPSALALLSRSRARRLCIIVLRTNMRLRSIALGETSIPPTNLRGTSDPAARPRARGRRGPGSSAATRSRDGGGVRPRTPCPRRAEARPARPRS